MDKQQLQVIKEEYDNMDWEQFREDAGDLVQREIEIYDTVVIEGVPALIAEVERLREALEFYADKENWKFGKHKAKCGTIYATISQIEADGGQAACKALEG